MLAYLALAAVCIIWGTTYLALRIAVGNFPPFLFTALRQILAGSLILLTAFFLVKSGWPAPKQLLRHAVAGFFMISLGNGLVAWSEMFISSGIAAIICSTMPVVVILINLAISREEKTNALILFGVLTGLAGIVLIFSENLTDLSNSGYLAGIIFTFIAVVSWAGASTWMKKSPSNTNLYVNAALQMLFGGVLLLPISLAFDDYSTITFRAQAVWPFIYLVIFGSIVAYLCYSYALRKLPLTLVSLYAYINPLVAVLLGWIVLGEKLNVRIAIAAAVTIAGIFLVNKGYQQVREWRAAVSKP